MKDFVLFENHSNFFLGQEVQNGYFIAMIRVNE